MSGESLCILDEDSDRVEALKGLLVARGFDVTAFSNAASLQEHFDRVARMVDLGDEVDESGSEIDLLIAVASSRAEAIALSNEAPNAEGAKDLVLVAQDESYQLVGIGGSDMNRQSYAGEALVALIERYLQDGFLPLTAEARLAQESQSISATAAVTGGSRGLAETIIQPSWPQDKADFLKAMREAKVFYEELHSIFAQGPISNPSDNRATDRKEFRAQVDANHDLMESTAEVMEAEFARDVPDLKLVRQSKSVFRVLGENAKAMGKLFAEGFFREMGREAATRVPWLLLQLQEKMHYLRQVLAHFWDGS